MKTFKYILISFALSCIMPSCIELDVPPVNVVTDNEVFGNEAGIRAFFARQYGAMPLEDFRFAYNRNGYNDFWQLRTIACITGEAISREVGGADNESHNYWAEAYNTFRDLNYFLETIKSYQDIGGYTDAQIDSWCGEVYFIRAMVYFTMVKRYGGVPIVTRVLDFVNEPLESFDIPRSSEEEVYNQIAEDFDRAYAMLPETNAGATRANKYTAMGFKSRAMLYAGSIALYNTTTLFDGDGKQLCGIPRERAAHFFKQSYDAAKILENKYSLYKKAWNATDREAQYKNFVDLFFDTSSPENIFIRQHGYPNSVHGYDCYNIAYQYMVGGYSSETNPTLNFVEMFDGLPKGDDGRVQVFDDQGYYIRYNDRMDFFANAEPRLRASVIFPGDVFKGEVLDVYRGVYHDAATIASGITRLLPEGSMEKYNAVPSISSRILMATNPQQIKTITDNAGNVIPEAGRSGCYNDNGVQCLGGFSVRKFMNPNMPANLVIENRSDQHWIELRYAEVLLNRAEAAYELYILGQGDQYRTDAYDCVKQIQERAGANITPAASDLTLDLVRKERRKELAFENKIWWDLRRWRVMHIEQNNTTWRILMPFFILNENKWFFDARLDERGSRYTYDTRWYYRQIPNARINESPSLIQNVGY